MKDCVLIPYNSILFRILKGLDGCEKKLCGKKNSLGISQRDYQYALESIKNLNMQLGCEVVEELIKKEEGTPKRYYRINPKILVECNINQINLRGKI